MYVNMCQCMSICVNVCQYVSMYVLFSIRSALYEHNVLMQYMFTLWFDTTHTSHVKCAKIAKINQNLRFSFTFDLFEAFNELSLELDATSEYLILTYYFLYLLVDRLFYTLCLLLTLFWRIVSVSLDQAEFPRCWALLWTDRALHLSSLPQSPAEWCRNIKSKTSKTLRWKMADKKHYWEKNNLLFDWNVWWN